MKKLFAVALAFCSVTSVFAWDVLHSVQVLNPEVRAPQIQLKNDSMPDEGGQGYLQQGFVAGEKAGVWMQVPANIKKFKVDFFRVLMTSSLNDATRTQVFFQMDVGNQPGAYIGGQIENAAEVTPGPYWNDIPAQGLQGGLPCVKGGEWVGAALEFTHQGLPSIMRDFDGVAKPMQNLLFAIPGGWKPSIQYGLQGDWILRIIGHEAMENECK